MKQKTLSLLIFMVFIIMSVFPDDSEPILRMNTEMHTDFIRGIDTDVANRYIVTASEDRTARLWEAETGRLLKVFRPYLSSDGRMSGMLEACAISPVGDTVAVACNTTPASYHVSVHFFSTETGALIHSVGEFTGICSLKYAPGGRYLAVAMTGGDGVSIIDTRDFNIVYKLDGYTDLASEISFSRDGRLAVVSYDGWIRLYDPQFNLVKKVKLDGGNKPEGIAFSPDRKRIAVSYVDSRKVEVFNGEDLEFLYNADTADIPEDDSFGSVAWSRDSRYLYAGGTYSRKADGRTVYPVRRWDNQGRGRVEDFSTANGAPIDSLLAVKEAGVIFHCFGSFPQWGRLDRSGKQVINRHGPVLEFYSNTLAKTMKVNRDATRVSFQAFRQTPCTFSLSDLSLQEGTFEGSVSNDQLGGISVSDWRDESIPTKINGNPIEGWAKKFTDECNSVSVDPSENRVILGTSYLLFAFSAEAEELWRSFSASEIRAVNCANDGRTVVTATADGLLHWYRLSDGKELLTLFVHTDLKRWVLWTSSGYYACSPGGEDLIGWHVNNGANHAADFYSVSRFSDRFYRPDIVSLMLETLEEDTAIAQANGERNMRTTDTKIASILPPVLTILSPSDGSNQTTSTTEVRYSVRTPNGDPLQEVRAMVNGRPVETSRGLKVVASNASGAEKTIRIPLSPGENYISLMGKNSSAWSDPAILMVKYQQKQQEFVAKPKLYILAVGVSDYANPDYRLNYAAKDARDFVATMKAQEGGIYREVEVKLLTDSDASQGNVFDGLDWIRSQATARDVAMIFVAGHGVTDNTGRLYYLAYEADLDRLRRTGIDADEFTTTVQSIPGKVLYFMDTCHSGGVHVESRRGVGDLDMTGIINELASAESGAVVFASSSGRQYSLEDDSWGNGAFTKALIEGLKGGADYTGSGKITINMLDLYISERVKELTRGQQTPTTAKPDTVPDYPIAVRE